MTDQAEQEAQSQGETYKKLLDMVSDLNMQLEECKAGKTASPGK